ncbi:MAG: S-layer homology domain-containing protein [Candidatus Gracilibacteria bacterium]|nr:S-layer homology domain-containing protein [Candidatus Gracilibacteria bacterium]
MKRWLLFLCTIFLWGNAVAFNDVAPDDPDRPVFEHLRDVGIMGAYPDGNFLPSKVVTRAEALVISLRAGGIGIPEFDGTTPFSDVNPNAWYAAHVDRGVELEFLATESGKFRPDDAVTKAEFLAFLFRATLVDFRPFFGRTKGIADDIPEEAWFAPHFAYAKKYQIAHLPADNKYNPYKWLSRREVALMTFRQLRIFHGDAVTKNFLELQAHVQQFVTLQRAGKTEEAQALLPRIFELSDSLVLLRNDEDSVAAQAISRAIKHIAESVRAFKFGKNLSALEHLFLATNHSQRAAEKSGKLSPFATDLLHLVDESLQNFINPNRKLYSE